jgi:cytochrome P450
MGYSAVYSRFDITSHAFWSRPFNTRDETFAQLRATDRLTWHPPMPSLLSMREMREDGFWALTRRADIAFASQHPELFVAACSARLPMMTITEMLGVPESDRQAVAVAAEKLFSMSDDE